jgi:hypothetical protein
MSRLRRLVHGSLFLWRLRPEPITSGTDGRPLQGYFYEDNLNASLSHATSLADDGDLRLLDVHDLMRRAIGYRSTRGFNLLRDFFAG